MSNTRYKNAVDCGKMLAFSDSAGRVSHVAKEDMDQDIEIIYSNPDALRVFRDSLEDYADGRFVDFEL
ncbi:hypothetical protein [Corynebacterium accolens]|jgi:hypothetical protein|uniref:Uncharacterized protein n=1 Tax=Corynebacterium accolens TaxID=38284 RepID=A0ABT7FQT4_9CORY|nr:hypothetical protein [Corynebacterium accolens]MDK4232808.1 hypothetical protein [Corynebacterium accolens]MDK4247953.1 hypothetical protein [Corynebacterium accolens]MDK4269002.1 hypothetical protein [Corynebacterium accolens]MDK4295227.1 hypothetical protein [Corynebacterium accolens]MDK4311352.1 hypothetical protein [Corynebacterium accolens]